MNFATAIDASQFPELFQRFEQLIDSSTWSRRVRAVESEIKGSRFLKEYLHHENRLAFTLQGLTDQQRRDGNLKSIWCKSPAHYEAYGFVAQCMSVFDSLPNSQVKHELVRRV